MHQIPLVSKGYSEGGGEGGRRALSITDSG